MTHPSIAEISETLLVDQLVSSPLRASTLFGIVGMGMGPDAISLTRLDLADLPGDRRGDVDILRVNPMRPELAIAFQAKRIKVSARAIATGQPGKLRRLNKAVRQTNLLAKIGFSQVYLYVFVVVDSREQNAGRRTYDGAPAGLKSLIEQALSPVATALDPRAGFVHWEFVQPMDYPPLTIGADGGKLARLAKPITQPAEVTAWVERELSRRAAPSHPG